MDLSMLKKKLSTYRTSGGRLMRVPDELAFEILLAWEKWSGPGSGFYSALGVDHRKMASVLGRAKKLKREGIMSEPAGGFKEVKIASPRKGSFIEIRLSGSRVIRFSNVEQVIEFLDRMEKKAS